jgi:ligand-binding SRPBCC domain-containing protein
LIALRFESVLRAPAAEVWNVVSRMSGVNAELMPLLRMSCPAEYRERCLLDAPLNTPLFACWLLLFGWLPVDRHVLMLERAFPGEGFDERSRSWVNRVWVHRRRMTALSGGSRVVDELEFEPRLSWMSTPLKSFVALLFRHRHRVLRRRFGCG